METGWGIPLSGSACPPGDCALCTVCRTGRAAAPSDAAAAADNSFIPGSGTAPAAMEPAASAASAAAAAVTAPVISARFMAFSTSSAAQILVCAEITLVSDGRLRSTGSLSSFCKRSRTPFLAVLSKSRKRESVCSKTRCCSCLRRFSSFSCFIFSHSFIMSSMFIWPVICFST